MAKPRKTTEGFADGSRHLVHATLDVPYRMYMLRRLGLDVLQVNARSVSEAVMKINLTEEREFRVKSQTENSAVLVSTPEDDEYTLEVKHA